ncbi:MAG: DUF192 domain-containing protein [Burkholderiales bacterium]|nr:DUF192 domain-containing protein [Burkholderiales bacterium]
MMQIKPLRLAIASLTLLAGAIAAAQTGSPQSLPTITLNAGMHLIRAQVADDGTTRQIGLMFRKDMPANDGMLFVFERADQQCFWMRNTLLPLSIAFVADDGSIVNIEDMKPMTEDSHCSAKPVRYVLEMNQGWFARRGLKAGARLSGPPFVK